MISTQRLCVNGIPTRELLSESRGRCLKDRNQCTLRDGKMLDAKVNLKLWVKVKKDWRDSDFLIKNFGYREEE